MVDFGALMKSGNRTVEIDPELIFEQLLSQIGLMIFTAAKRQFCANGLRLFATNVISLSNSILEVEKRSSAC